MGIEMVLLERHHLNAEDLFCPVVKCDVCGKLIEESGNVLYKGKQVFFAHKADWPCTGLMDQRYGRLPWMDLKEALIALNNNFNKPLSKVKGRLKPISPQLYGLER